MCTCSEKHSSIHISDVYIYIYIYIYIYTCTHIYVNHIININSECLEENEDKNFRKDKKGLNNNYFV